MTTCICGSPIEQHEGKGRPAQFCSTRCRVAAHRAKASNNVTETPSQDKQDVTIIERHQPVEAPFSWFGGKRNLAPRIASLLPAHKVYVEVFGGSGAVLFYKRPSPIEVYNDLDSGLVNFFRVLRNPEQSAQLQRLLSLTPYSREEWRNATDTWLEVSDPIDQARTWYTALKQSFSSHFDGNGWSFAKDTSNNPARAWQTSIENLPAVAARLARVQIEHSEYARLLANYDSADTCFYLDPPYLPETRKRHGYRHELTREDHEQMLSQLLHLQGKVLLSGYRSALYDEILASWERIDIPVMNVSSNTTREARTECIWLSPNIARQPSLWEITA